MYCPNCGTRRLTAAEPNRKALIKMLAPLVKDAERRRNVVDSYVTLNCEGLFDDDGMNDQGSDIISLLEAFESFCNPAYVDQFIGEGNVGKLIEQVLAGENPEWLAKEALKAFNEMEDGLGRLLPQALKASGKSKELGVRLEWAASSTLACIVMNAIKKGLL